MTRSSEATCGGLQVKLPPIDYRKFNREV